MYASSVTKTVETDGGPALVRKLSAKSLDKAFQARQIQSMRDVKEAGPDLMRMFQEIGSGVAEDMEKKKEDPAAKRRARYAAYDRDTVLVAGVVSLPGADKVTTALLDDLDMPTATLLHEAIVDLSVPEDEGQEGKD